MALAELCDMPDFGCYKAYNPLDSDVLELSKNFGRNVQLAVPPFSNVSF